MTLDLEQFACRILEGETPEEVQQTIAAAREDYDADIRAAGSEEGRDMALAHSAYRLAVDDLRDGVRAYDPRVILSRTISAMRTRDGDTA